MNRILSKKQQGRHNAFVRLVKSKLVNPSIMIPESQIRECLGQTMDIERAADAFIEKLNNS
ncbi:hypothetical protein [uncultured Alteromonas sp.]|jgi:hypothetical protein|uniref:hypothetical protein n=1 Tax=uncultured Alteromonas sp. TaxID=179113 RepID=UPI0030D05357